MKVFCILYGAILLVGAMIAQAMGVAEIYEYAAYHHIWWSFVGGLIFGIGLVM